MEKLGLGRGGRVLCAVACAWMGAMTCACSGHSGASPGGDAGQEQGDSGGEGPTGPQGDGGPGGVTGNDAGGPSGSEGPDGSVGYVPGGQAGPGTTFAGCQIFPNDNSWNVEVNGPAVQVTHTYDAQLKATTKLHPDFGDFTPDGYGIPINVVDGGAPDLPTTFTLYASESDPGPGGWVGTNPVTANADMGVTAYPFFQSMEIEGNPAAGGSPGSLPGDQHGIVLQQGASGCVAYEAWNCVLPSDPSFTCANGAVFDLTSNKLRTLGWTSGDAAGLSILAGLVRLSEVQTGVVTHAIRMTFSQSQSGYLLPATHAAGSHPLGSAYVPMGLRLRMKASVDISPYSAPSQVIMTAMKKYGVIVADNGSDWFFQGESNDGWETTMLPDGNAIMDDLVSDFGKITGGDFEAVYTGDPIATGL